MKKYFKFNDANFSQIKINGWLRKYLEIQRDGLTGHLEVAGYPFNTDGWSGKKIEMRSGEPWWPYEQLAYWTDAMIRCGLLLDDEFLLKKARKQLDNIIENPDKDGYIGPECIKDPELYQGRWSHLVFFRAYMALYSAESNDNIIKNLTAHYLSDISDHHGMRDVCNIEIMLWLYGINGNEGLLKRAVDAYEKFNKKYPDSDISMKTMLSEKVATEHGVTYCETIKLPAILYLYTGRKKYLKAAEHAYKKIDRNHMLVDGINSSSESLAGKTSLDAHETCDIVDYTWGAGYMLMATGKSEYADKIEYACLNAAPGAVKDDFKALQYFSSPNQVIACKNSAHTPQEKGGKWMSFRPKPGTECCSAQLGRTSPNFISRMWMLNSRKDGITAMFYGSSEFSFTNNDGKKIKIIEETDYPFSENISFRIEMDKNADKSGFALNLRIPGWCEKASVKINDSREKAKISAGNFLKIERDFFHNDRIELKLPMELELLKSEEGGISVKRGPLLFALKIKEKWEKEALDESSSEDFPNWSTYPASDWNYALCVNRKNLRKKAKIIIHDTSLKPWQHSNPPLEIILPAKKVKNWKIRKLKSVENKRWTKARAYFTETDHGDFQLTPPLPGKKTIKKNLSKKKYKISLIPYGCTNLRISVFPNGNLK